jgi:hypothetical protein
MAEERFVTEATTPHQPVTASDQDYGPANTRPVWVDQLPVPDYRPWTAVDGNHDPAPTIPPDYGGTFDGFTVASDADPGL